MYIPDDGETEEVAKDEFIEAVMEILFGADATHGESDEPRNFSYEEALEELMTMNSIYTEYIERVKEKFEKMGYN